MINHTDPPPLSSENGQIRLKVNELFLVCDEQGDITSEDAAFGLYWHGTRFLNELSLAIVSAPSENLSHAVADDGSESVFDVAVYSAVKQAGLDDALRDIHLARKVALSDRTLTESMTFTRYHTDSHDLTVRLTLSADFLDIFEIRGIHHAERGQLLHPALSSGAADLQYQGRDGIRRAVRLTFSPPTSENTLKVDRDAPGGKECICAEWRLSLSQATPTTITVVATVWEGDPATPGTSRWPASDMGQQAPRPARPLPELASDDALFDQMLSRGMDDLRMMCVRTPEGLFPYGGMPWYVCPFGRDSLITGLEFLPWFPEIARGALDFLAARQGKAFDDFTEEQPGRILHELRVGELANLREIPFIPYYGTVDATPLFIIALEQYIRWTNDTAFLARLWPHALAAAQWMLEYGDSNNDGFLDYQRSDSAGLVNQGWKDSSDAISHEDGRLAEGPIALCEAQAYAYAAFRAVAWLAQESGLGEQAEQWEARAHQLQERFIERFWWPEQQCYYLALDGSGEPCRVVSSNVGHCLWAGIATQEHGEAIVERLMRPDVYTQWGIRTLSSQTRRFNPMSYHNGSVWPHDTAMIGAGFARYGFHEQAAQLLGSLYGVSLHYEGARLPELFCGFSRVSGRGPTRYPVACSPQSWAAGAPFLLVSALLGFEPDAKHHRLTVHHPSLPAWLQRLELSGLRVGQIEGRLRFDRAGNGTMVTLSQPSEMNLQVFP